MTRSAGPPYRARPRTTPRRLPYTPLPPHAGPTLRSAYPAAGTSRPGTVHRPCPAVSCLPCTAQTPRNACPKLPCRPNTFLPVRLHSGPIFLPTYAPPGPLLPTYTPPLQAHCPSYLYSHTPPHSRSAQVQLCRPTLHASAGGHSRPRTAVRQYHRRGPSDQLL